MHLLLIQKKAILAVTVVLLSFLLGIVLVKSSMLAAALALFPLVWYFFFSDKRNLLFIFIIILPFINAPVLSHNIMGIPGAKPFNLLAALCLAGFFFHGGRLLPDSDVEKKVLVFFLLYFIIFTIATFRTLSYLPLLHHLWPDAFHGSPLRHLLSTFVQPGLYFIPFVFIIKFFKTDDDISQIVRVICISCFIFSVVVLCVSLPNLSLIIQSRENTRELFNTFLGMHYNAVGSLYLSVYPLLLNQAFTRKPFDIINLFLAVCAILLLQSRSAIVITLFSTCLYLFLSGRRLFLIWLTTLVAGAVVAWLPFFLIRTFQTGVGEGDLNAILTNRIDQIWGPVLSEWFANTKLLLFGRGRYAIMTSHAYRMGHIFQVTHAHNAYFDFFLNVGLVLSLPFFGFVVWSIRLAWKTGRRINDMLFWSFFICILSFLTGGFTQRDFLPSHENLFLFPVAALMINYALLRVPRSNENPVYRF